MIPHPCPGCRCATGDDNAILACQCAQKLSALRDEAGETQRQLALRLQMTESVISRLERGDHLPSLKTLCRIAQAYGCRLEIVFREQEHQPADGMRRVRAHGRRKPDPHPAPTTGK